ncbi:hypothetical protein F4776DRAFT_669380 [Hypoxylon sp. NC0597]|nr:hypothetical protein F4776DRAFT_669380 [Hypoxylon sp. NC0597]
MAQKRKRPRDQSLRHIESPKLSHPILGLSLSSSNDIMVKFIALVAIACAGLAAAVPVSQGVDEVKTGAEKRTNGYIGYGSEGEYEAVNNKKRTNGYIGYGSEGEYEAVNSEKRTNGYIGYGSEGEYEAVNDKN